MDYDRQLSDFTTRLREQDAQREEVATELEALQSIYGSGSIRLWSPSRRNVTVEDDPLQTGEPLPIIPVNSDEKTRFEVLTTLSEPHESTEVRILVTIPATYPASAPPQLQLLSRYVGNHGVDSTIFGAVLRTYIAHPGVEWSLGDVAIFDGLEFVKSSLDSWYRDRLSENLAQKLRRDDLQARDVTQDINLPSDERIEFEPEENIVELPAGIKIVQGEAILDRKSVFVGRACTIADPSQVRSIVDFLLSDRKISRAAHPVIHAWRCEVNGIMHQDNDDDGETAAGARLAHLLQILDLTHVLVVVTRYFGGIHLGPDRFKHISAAARDAIERAGLLDDTFRKESSKGSKRK